jgi:quinol monooxygenase YgiN
MSLAAVTTVTGGRSIAMEQQGLIVRMAELDIDPAQLEAYKTLLTEEIEASVRIEPGVLSLNAVSIKDNPSHIRILEVYLDQNAYQAHLRSPHFLEYKQRTATMVHSLRLIETEPIRLCSKTGTDSCR